MNYSDLYLELEGLLNEEFSIDFIYKVTNILSRAKELYFNNIRKLVSDNNEQYNQFIFLVDDLLKNKIKLLDNSFSNVIVNNIANGIEKSSINVHDILKLDNYVLLKGSPVFSFSNKEYFTIVDNNLKDISSYDFSNFYKKTNYLSSLFGKNVIRKLVDILNSYFKSYFNLDSDILLYVDCDIIYCIPMMNIYLSLDLNTICENIINNEICNIEVLTTYNNEEVHLFNLKMNMEKYNIEEVNSNIWKLSDQESKKKIK